MKWLFNQFYLFIAGHHPWSRCWMGLHKWDYPGGHCRRCGKCDEFLGPHPSDCQEKRLDLIADAVLDQHRGGYSDYVPPISYNKRGNNADSR